MKFSRFKNLFFLLSIVGMVALLGITFGYYNGFERSITFDGGIRLTIQLPKDMGREDLLKASEKAGLPGASARVVDYKRNQYDLEFGPDVRDRIRAEIEAYEKQHEATTPPDGEQATKRETRTVPGEIEKLVLPELGLTPENVISKAAISASYGQELFIIAMESLALAIVLIGLYLTFRFDFPFAVGASAALVHDLIFTVGFIGVMRIEPSVPVVAAVLTVLGYSINDTIVIFDRIRANIDDINQAAQPAIMDDAINQTLSRTILTSLLTLIAVVALIVGGATSLVDFAYIILFGILIGTYSSIFVASHLVQVYSSVRRRMKKARA
ncbi:MAG: protein translocase subunit SecF [Leptospiraceae bacterium]|nr:protein translocase subunit SecF [Leptospiraceae bacterium]